MIKNERQYRITKTQLQAFQAARNGLLEETFSDEVNRQFAAVHQSALESQIDELSSEVQEYEALKSGKFTSFEATSFAELPNLLVKARIASGLNHKELADRLKLKEQQVQRWESSDYAGTSIENLKAVADALGVVVTQQMYVPRANVTPANFLHSMKDAGLPVDFILKRVLNPPIAEQLRTKQAGLTEIVNAAHSVARVFGLKTADLVDLKPQKLNVSSVAATRFKLPGRLNKEGVSGYVVYAHYLAALVTTCSEEAVTTALPRTSHSFFQAVSRPGIPMNLENVIRLLWRCGVVVLPLDDAGGFHGAVWRIGDRFVIVLKQGTQLASRWLFDALHEVGHIVNGHVTDGTGVIENEEISPAMEGDDEELVNGWAEDTLFNGKSEEIEVACTEGCGGNLQRLKAVIPKVAKTFNVGVGVLANHMAYRLAEQNETWWGAANNLQDDAENPFTTARRILLEQINLSRINSFDRDLLQRAITER